MAKDKNTFQNFLADPIGFMKSSTIIGGGKATVKNVRTLSSPVQFTRVRQDIQKWREAIAESEQAYYPQRTKMQQLFQDTVLNGHVDACMNKRKNLTLLKDFALYNGDVENIEATKLIDKEWFSLLISYCLDAKFYGYSLVGFGDIVNDEFPNIQLVKRWHVSPDRLNVTRWLNSTTGVSFEKDNEVEDVDGSLYDWSVYIATPSETGASICGYGLLYKVALYEIFLRNIMGYNADFVELFAMPYRVGKTTKTEGVERDNFEAAIRDMGSASWAVVDPTEEIEFLNSGLAGTGYKAYESFEKRCEGKISKIILGHADAIDSTVGKLGSNTAVEDAIREISTTDNRYIENIVNGQILPKIKALGIAIPDGLIFKFKNNDELEEFRQREDASNKATADIALVMKNAGFDVDATYLSERTGIPLTKAATPEPIKQTPFSGNVQAKLNNLYGTTD